MANPGSIPGGSTIFPFISSLFCSPVLQDKADSDAVYRHKKMVNPLLRRFFQMPTESKAHSREHLVLKIGVAARTETLV